MMFTVYFAPILDLDPPKNICATASTASIEPTLGTVTEKFPYMIPVTHISP